MSRKSIIILTAALFMFACKADRKVLVYDDFEGDTLNRVWRTDKFVPGAMTLQKDIVRTGEKSCRLTLRPGDQIEEETGSEFERAELRERNDLMADENRDYSYSFSLFLPEDFPALPVRLVIAQWKQNCHNEECDPDNPVIAIRFESGELFITLQTGPGRKTLFKYPETITGEWMDFRFNIRFSRKPDGKLTAWLNGKEIINFDGPTAYEDMYGYPYPGKFYFKTGLYRDRMNYTMTIYIDNYLKEELKKY
jgi:hypothetical protein